MALKINFGQHVRTIARLRLLQRDEPEKRREEVDPWGTAMPLGVVFFSKAW